MKPVDVIECLGALAQESRLAIYRLLVKRGPEGYTPGDLATKTEIPAPTLSFHLKEPPASGVGCRASRGAIPLLQRELQDRHLRKLMTSMKDLDRPGRVK